MNQPWSLFGAMQKSMRPLLFCCTLFAFQQANAQHCFPGFQFSATNNTVTFTNTSTADGTIVGYNWDFGDGHTSTEQNPTHSYSVTGTYEVCLSITAHNPDCSSTYCHHVVLIAGGMCHAAFSAHQPNLDHPIIDFTDQSTSDGTIGSWFWNFGDGETSTEQNPSHTFAAPGTYLVCLTITDIGGGCSSHVCQQVVVHHPPVGVCHAAFSAHQPNQDHSVIDFTDQSTSDGTIGSWSWDFGDGQSSTEQNPSHTFAAPGTYLVCLTITDIGEGCSSHVCQQVVVHHPPVGVCHAAFSAHQPNQDHPVIDFTDQSTSDGTIGSWSWDFGDGQSSTQQNPSHTFAAPGTYLVCLTITDIGGGCSSHVCQEVVVHSPAMDICHAAYSLQPDSSGLGFQFTNTSSGTTSHTTYLWQFGDGSSSTQENPFHLYTHTGQFTVCLFIADSTTGCNAHFCHVINVHHMIVHHHFSHHVQMDHEVSLKSESRVERSIETLSKAVLYPNPTSGVFEVDYHLATTATVSFELFRMDGARALSVAAQVQAEGEHAEVISLATLPTGVYMLKMDIDGKSKVYRVVVEEN